MSEVQDPTNNAVDPRWLTIRVSRINLAVTLIGAAVAFPAILIVQLPPLTQVSLLAMFTFALGWDLYVIYLKAPDSARAFSLFDLDRPATTPGDAASNKAKSTAPVLGIRLRVTGTSLAGTEKTGTVLRAAFVSPWFTTLRYRLPEDSKWRRCWPHIIPLWADSLDKEEFRKVRVALRWK